MSEENNKKEVERRPNTIILFKNSNIKHGKSPVFFGSVTWEDGDTKEIVLWKKVGAKGNEFYTGMLKELYEKEEKAVESPPEEEKAKEVTNSETVDKQQNTTQEDNDLDDLPF